MVGGGMVAGGSLRSRIDEGFGELARLASRRRILTLLLILAGVGALLSQLPQLRADNSNEVFFHPNDPTLEKYHAFQDQFGRDEMIIIAVTPPEVFERGFLEKLGALHRELEDEVPYLDEVTSLINVRETRGEADELIVEDLLEVIPRESSELARLEERVLASELYPNLYISEDGKVITLLLETVAYSPAEEGGLESGFEEEEWEGEGAEGPRQLTAAENAEIIHAVRRVVTRFEGPDFPIRVTGSPVIDEFLNWSIGRDVSKFVTLTFISFAIFLLILFRRFSGAVIPLIVVIVSLLTTVSLLAIFDRPFSSVTSILPSFMMSVGVGSSVHVLAIFFREFRRSGEKEEALVYTYRHTGMPVAMTSLTTAAGLLSFATASIAPVADLGIFGGVGVMVILFFTLVLIPALVSLLPLRTDARFAGKAPGKGLDRLLVGIANFSTRRAGWVVLASGLILVLAGSGLFWQGFGHNYINWLKADSPERRNIEYIDDELKGSGSIEVLIDTGTEDGLYDPAILNDLDRLRAWSESYQGPGGEGFVGKTSSVLNVLKETHRALNENDPDQYLIPQDRALIAQELLLFENSGSDDLEKLVDSQFSQARLSAKVINRDASEYVDFAAALEAEAERLFAGRAEVTVTGHIKLFTHVVHLLLVSLSQSYAIAAVVITALMIAMLGSIRVGLLSMIPNLAPIVITMGVMGWLGIRLDMSNMLLGTVAIGLAVDDTIHFFHNFRNAYAQSGDVEDAVRQTMLGTGRAMLFTTLVLVTGFWLFMFASLVNLIHFGFLIGVTLIIALLADILLAPALLQLIARSPRGRAGLERWVEAKNS